VKQPEVKEVKEEPKKVNIHEAPKPTRSIGGVTITGDNVGFVAVGKEQAQMKIEPTKEMSILELLSAPSTTQQALT
jgi:hypothetical protein